MPGDVFYLSKERRFSLTEAQKLLLVINKITQQASESVQKIIDRMEKVHKGDAQSINEQEAEINKIIENWQAKIIKLGALPKGIWIVDFDFGDGYLCWKFPESKIEYWHAYGDGYTKRKKLPIDSRPVATLVPPDLNIS